MLICIANLIHNSRHATFMSCNTPLLLSISNGTFTASGWFSSRLGSSSQQVCLVCLPVCLAVCLEAGHTENVLKLYLKCALRIGRDRGRDWEAAVSCGPSSLVCEKRGACEGFSNGNHLERRHLGTWPNMRRSCCICCKQTR